MDEPPAVPRAVEPARSPDAATERLIVRSSAKVLVLSLVVLALALLAWRLRVLLLLIVVSTFVAVLINPAVHFVQRRIAHRTLAATSVYLVLVVVGFALGFALLHPLYDSALHFAHELLPTVRRAQAGKGWIGRIVKRLHLVNYVHTHVGQLETAITHLSKPALAVGKSVASGIVSIITIVFMSFFIVLEGPRVLEAALSLASPRWARITRQTIDAVTNQVTGFMIGDFATSVIAGLVVFVTLEITSVPFAGVLAIWVGLVDFLPLVGGLLAGVPTVALAFLHSVLAGIVTIVVFLVYQQIENHILYPIIVSRTVSLNPLLVLLAVLIGAETGDILGSTFGAIAGALLAVPAAGSLQVAVREYLREHHGATRASP